MGLHSEWERVFVILYPGQWIRDRQKIGRHSPNFIGDQYVTGDPKFPRRLFENGVDDSPLILDQSRMGMCSSEMDVIRISSLENPGSCEFPG